MKELVEIAKRKAEERRKLTGEDAEIPKMEFPEANPSTGETSPKTAYIESQKRKAEAYNRTPGKLDGYDCPECKNRGSFFAVDENGYLISTQCKCMTIRKNRRRVEQSGLSDLLSRYTFKAWQTDEAWQKEILDGAKRFAANPDGWFSVSGKPGTGKTHICTAICGALMRKGYDVRYMLWRDVATTLKANSTADAAAYSHEITPLKTVQVLYIDDFFKTGGKRPPTVMDTNLAFEIINARYNAKDLITIVSSERSLDELMRIDEATASRIYERTKKNRNYYNLAGMENRRMKQEV